MKEISMKKNFLIIIAILILLVIISSYAVFEYRKNAVQAEKVNNEYSSYYQREMLGSELISIVNRTIDINEKNEVRKDENGYYIDNEKDSIQISIIFIYQNETKTLRMEDIEKGSTESFIQSYSTANFKCTSIEYHEKTKQVKKLVFEEFLDTMQVNK